MFARTATLLSALSLAVGSANAYSNLTSASDLEIQAIEAHFTQSLLVPSFLSSFSPQGLLDVSWSGYGNGIQPGAAQSKDAVAEEPYLEVIPASNASSIASGSSYAVMMVDADIAGTESSVNKTFHWLAYNVALPSGDAPYDLARGADAAIAYVGPGPLEGTGAHRYVVMVYAQPSGFTAPSAPTAFGAYNFEDYISSAGLGDLVAANYFTVENGQATVTPSATSAVETSTLAAAAASTSNASASSSSSSSAASSVSGSASSRSSGSASKSASATTSGGASAAASSSSAADRKVAVVAGTGMLGALVTIVMAL